MYVEVKLKNLKSLLRGKKQLYRNKKNHDNEIKSG